MSAIGHIRDALAGCRSVSPRTWHIICQWDSAGLARKLTVLGVPILHCATRPTNVTVGHTYIDIGYARTYSAIAVTASIGRRKPAQAFTFIDVCLIPFRIRRTGTARTIVSHISIESRWRDLQPRINAIAGLE